MTSSGSRVAVRASFAAERAPASPPPAVAPALTPAPLAPSPVEAPAAPAATASPGPPALPLPRAGAKVADTGGAEGVADGPPSGSLPQTPVWPGASPPRSLGIRTRLPSGLAGACAPGAAPRPSAALVERPFETGPPAVRSWSVDPAALAARVAGESSVRSGVSNAIRRPATSMPSRITIAPGAVRAGSRMLTRKRPMRPPVNSPEKPTSWISPRKPAYAIAMPSRVRPHGAPGSRPGPHSRYQPDTSSTTGSAKRPAPKNGAMSSRTRSVSRPSPGRIRAMASTAPRTASRIPISERMTAGDRPSEIRGSGRPPPRRRLDDRVRRAAGGLEVVRRRCATR